MTCRFLPGKPDWNVDIANQIQTGLSAVVVANQHKPTPQIFALSTNQRTKGIGQMATYLVRTTRRVHGDRIDFRIGGTRAQGGGVLDGFSGRITELPARLARTPPTVSSNSGVLTRRSWRSETLGKRRSRGCDRRQRETDGARGH